MKAALLLFFGLYCLPSSASIAVVATGTQDCTTSACTTPTLTRTTTGATLLTMSIAISGGFNSCTATTITETLGNTWTLIGPQTSTTASICLAYAWQHSGSALATGTDVISVSTSASVVSFSFTAYSGTLATSNPYESVTNGANTGSGTATSLATGSMTPTQAGSLVVTAASLRSQPTPYTVDSGFTVNGTVSFVSGTVVGVGDAYLVTGSAVNPAWTMPGAGQMAVLGAAFRPATTTTGVRRKVIP